MMTSPMSTKCEGCPHLKHVGEFMVGGERDGGPEDFYTCRNGWNIDYYYYSREEVCPDKPYDEY